MVAISKAMSVKLGRFVNDMTYIARRDSMFLSEMKKGLNFVIEIEKYNDIIIAARIVEIVKHMISVDFSTYTSN